MAGDENGIRHEGLDPAAAPRQPEAAGPGKPAGLSEWTASDARGTLRAAKTPPAASDADATALPADRLREAAGEPVHEPLEDPVVAPTSESAEFPIHEPVQEPIQDAINESAEAPRHEPAQHSTLQDPVHEPIHEFPADPVAPAAVAATGASASEPALQSGEPASRSARVWPLAAALVVGALVGAGSAYFVYVQAGGARSGRLTALTGRIDALEARPDAGQDVAPVKATVAALAGRVAALEGKLAVPNAKPATPGTKPVTPDAKPVTPDAKSAASTAPAPEGAAPAKPTPEASSAADVAALGSKVAALQTGLQAAQAAQKQAAPASELTAAQAKLAAIALAVADVQHQVNVSRDNLQSLESGQKSLEGKITSAPALAVVADSLVAQIQRGQPFATQVAALDSLGVTPARLAVLRQSADAGVPTAAALAAKFEPLTDAILSSETPSRPDATFWDKLKGGFAGLVSVRRADDVNGTDVASRVARIKADLARDDAVDAAATFALLPDSAKANPAVAAWGALAKTHAQAVMAADAVERDAIAALAKKS